MPRCGQQKAPSDGGGRLPRSTQRVKASCWYVGAVGDLDRLGGLLQRVRPVAGAAGSASARPAKPLWPMVQFVVALVEEDSNTALAKPVAHERKQARSQMTIQKLPLEIRPVVLGQSRSAESDWAIAG